MIIVALSIAGDEYAKQVAWHSEEKARNLTDSMKPEVIEYAIRMFGEKAAEARNLADTLQKAESITISIEGANAG